jgi:hypothetical protein
VLGNRGWLWWGIRARERATAWSRGGAACMTLASHATAVGGGSGSGRKMESEVTGGRWSRKEVEDDR